MMVNVKRGLLKRTAVTGEMLGFCALADRTVAVVEVEDGRIVQAELRDIRCLDRHVAPQPQQQQEHSHD